LKQKSQMITEVRLAQYGMGMQDATIVQWHKNEGDPVVAGDVILEVEAAKTAVDIEAPASGILSRIIAQVDDVVPVGDLLAEIASEGAAAATAQPADEPATPPASRVTPLTPTVQVPAKPSGPSDANQLQTEPRARRLAQETGVDLQFVEGSGPNGRITEADVQRHLEARKAPPSPAGTTPPTPGSDPEVVPLKGLRRSIAQAMVESLQTMAQLTLTSEADVTRLDERRALDGASVTYTALVMRAVVVALQKHPRMNATLENGELRISRTINLGVAVHTEHGLVAPVLHGAGDMDLRQISERLRAAAAAARERRASPAEFMGGTFTVTSLGQFGIDAFTPIIHAPQVGILGVGRVRERLVRGAAEPGWSKFITLSLTFDHRAMDGVPAAMFLQTVREALEEPDTLFE
jgi:pyruvate dehydrogenase E2 component (dihydrolipoamide acetyltransferase)